MSRISQFSVLVTTLVSVVAVVSSTAAAATWHNTGNTAYTATGGASTLSSAGSSIRCTSVDVTGASFAPSTTAIDLATLTATFTSCAVDSVLPAHMHCRVTFTGVLQDPSGTVTGTGDVHCAVTITGASPCTVTGSVGGSYTNPGAGATGRLHILHSAALTVSGNTCPLPGSGTLTAQTWAVTNGTGGTGALGPIFTRTS
jgi:hypothetical protein